jgi:predicted DNA-binding protein with PD1-like motif
MIKKKFDILEFKNENEIISLLENIAQKPLTPTTHIYSDYGEISIKEAAEKSTQNYFEKAKAKPAIALLSVVLAANRNYNKVVKPNIERIEKTDLITFDQLRGIIFTKSKQEFYLFWGHKDEKKYNTLIKLLEAIDELKKVNPEIKDDFEILNFWGVNQDLLNRKNDIIGKIPNIATATFQHLRMVFGVDTVKPDQRVKEVLDYEFGIPKLNDENAIKAVEQIAKIANLKVITVDQIFVNYGAGYFNQSANKLSVKEIAGRLKLLGVSSEIIKSATLLSLEQIKRL